MPGQFRDVPVLVGKLMNPQDHLPVIIHILQTTR
jgi:hypothetical protein